MAILTHEYSKQNVISLSIFSISIEGSFQIWKNVRVIAISRLFSIRFVYRRIAWNHQEANKMK